MNIEWKFNGITIQVKCPRCGRWGKLISKGRISLGGVKLAIKHDSERGVSIETCSIGICSEYYPELLKIYEECRRARERKRQRRRKIIQLAEP
ncbi:MAG: hypothetical protein DRN09_02040 [Thermoplasmata archaeon]|nr:MAG: hypothetical protein DRN09_02040 [Thermoplasmata archaeon]